MQKTDLSHAACPQAHHLIYAALIVWTVIALFPIFWTFSTTFKVAKDVQLGNIIPWLQYKPTWLGLRAIGLSPDTIFTEFHAARRVHQALLEFSIHGLGRRFGSGPRHRIDGGLWPQPLRVQIWLIWRNKDISFFFLSQLILPPVVLAMPFLVLYKELALLDSLIGLILIYT